MEMRNSDVKMKWAAWNVKWDFKMWFLPETFVLLQSSKLLKFDFWIVNIFWNHSLCSWYIRVLDLIGRCEACMWLAVIGVIDSSTWVAGGSDSSVTMETNAASWSTNHLEWVPWGFLKHMPKISSSPRYTNTHTKTHTHSFECCTVLLDRSVCENSFVYMCVCWADVCFLPVWCGLLSTPSLGRWRSCHGRVLLGPPRTYTYTHTDVHAHASRGQGSACTKRPNKPSVHTTNPPQTENEKAAGGNVRRCRAEIMFWRSRL